MLEETFSDNQCIIYTTATAVDMNVRTNNMHRHHAQRVCPSGFGADLSHEQHCPPSHVVGAVHSTTVGGGGGGEWCALNRTQSSRLSIMVGSHRYTSSLFLLEVCHKAVHLFADFIFLCLRHGTHTHSCSGRSLPHVRHVTQIHSHGMGME